MSCNNLFEEDEKEDLDQKAKEEENELVEVALKDKKTAKKKRLMVIPRKSEFHHVSQWNTGNYCRRFFTLA